MAETRVIRAVFAFLAAAGVLAMLIVVGERQQDSLSIVTLDGKVLAPLLAVVVV